MTDFNKNSFFEVEEAGNKSFGILFGLIFLTLSSYFLFLYKFLIFVPLFLISIIFLYLAFFRKNLLTKFKIIWLKFGYLLSKITNPIIMFFIFFIIFVPVGIFLKLFKVDLLNIRKTKSRKSTWKIRKRKIESMDKQF